MKRVGFIFTLIFSMLLIGCSASDDGKDKEQLEIYTTIYPVKYITEQLLGDDALVHSVYPPGVDAHTYEPASKDVTNIARADVFIYLGDNMESFSESVVNALQYQEMTFINLAENRDLFLPVAGKDASGELDPHIGFDPIRMIEVATTIKQDLAEDFPEKEALLEKNLQTIKQNLEAIDKQYIEVLENKTMKELLVTHGAYGYLEERYGIKQLPISGLTSTEEPSQKQLAELTRYAQDHDLDYVIFEQNSSNKLAKIIQEQIGAEALYMHTLENLSEDDIETKEDYISLMEKNLKVLDKATK